MPLDIIPKAVGTSLVSILADDMPLSTYKITVDSLSPTLNLVTPTSALPGETFIASVTAQDHGDPLRNMQVQWKVSGATIQNSDSITNQNGTANILLLPNAGSTINISTNATGLGYIPSHVSKMVTINGTGLDSNSNSTVSGLSPLGKVQSNLKSFKIGGIDTLPIIVLGTITISGVLIKRKSILSSIKKTPHNTSMQSK